MDQTVVLTFIIVGLIEVILPLAAGYFLTKRLKVKWSVYLWGVGFFIAIQLIHTPLVLIIQEPLIALAKEQNLTVEATIAVFSLVLGILAGLFEEVGRYLVFKHFFIKKKIALTTQNSIMFGLGWGGIESMLVGLLVVLTMFSYIAAVPLTGAQVSELNRTWNGTMTQEQVNFLNEQNEALMALTPGDLLPSLIERLMTMTLQITWTMMVYTAVTEGRNRLLVLAIITHAVVDGGAVYLGQVAGVFALESFVLVAVVAAIFYLKKTLPALKPTSD